MGVDAVTPTDNNRTATREQLESEIPNQFLAHVGEDRGARIHIKGSTFRHSKFCRGMISYT